MSRPVLAVAAILLTLGACATVRESRINPLNWFGQSEARPTSVRDERYEIRTDPRPLVDQVTAMAVEQIPGGAILRATGLPPTQGFWDAELVRYEGEGVGEGILVYDFRLSPPPVRTRQGTEFSREVEVATYLTTNDLAGIGRILVRGERTERSVRR